MAIIEIKGAGTFPSAYKTQTTSSTNSDNLEAVFLEKLQSIEGNNKVTAPVSPPVINASDKVVFTSVVQQMRKNTDSSSESSMNLEKIARIKQAIDSGTYQINSDSIAAKMMQYVM